VVRCPGLWPARPLPSCLATSAGAQPSERQFALRSVVLAQRTTRPALPLAPRRPPIQAPTLSKRCTWRRCRGVELSLILPCVIAKCGPIYAPTLPIQEVLGLISYTLWHPNIAQTSCLDLKPARKKAVNVFSWKLAAKRPVASLSALLMLCEEWLEVPCGSSRFHEATMSCFQLRARNDPTTWSTSVRSGRCPLAPFDGLSLRDTKTRWKSLMPYAPTTLSRIGREPSVPPKSPLHYRHLHLGHRSHALPYAPGSSGATFSLLYLCS
jgi:hypothetical protein